MGSESVVRNFKSNIFKRYLNSNVDAETDNSNGVCMHSNLVFTNNQKNEKLSDISQCDRNEESEDVDDIDDDWLSKLTNTKDGLRVPPTDVAYDLGMNYTEIPLLNEDLDFKGKTLRTLRVGLKKIWKRGSATITAEDPTYKVSYLGNVLTGWAKGDGCVEKPLNTLWKNYNVSSKPDVQMKISVTQSGLKAVTKDHGLIEYWSHRITYCSVPPGLPRVFCWIYRHEGRKLKQELRCHAVLCAKESVAARMATTLKMRLTQALLEFKRDKLLRQNARLSLVNSVYENPSLPRRKILLSIGCHNYKPPLERSKSAPKLMSIEESLEEEENSPKSKRKFSQDDDKEDVSRLLKEGERKKKKSSEEKCEYKLANLNFVKKLCCSIENLVESTSNYGKKFLTDHKSARDLYLPMKKSDELVFKKQDAEECREEMSNGSLTKENLCYKPNRSRGSIYSVDSGRSKQENDPKSPELVCEIQNRNVDFQDSNLHHSFTASLGGVSSLAESSADRSAQASSIGAVDAPVERIHNYLATSDDAFLDRVFNATNSSSKIGDSDPGKCEHVTINGTGYLDLAETLVNRLKLDSKQKDIPYHKIITSTALSQRPLQSSCLQI